MREILPYYFKYLSTHPNSLLARVYGLHAILIPNTSRNLHFTVMGNIFRTSNKMHARYDMKGSWIRREVGEAHRANPEQVLGMDLDLTHNLLVGPHRANQIRQLLASDSHFLKTLGIMDYSLLIGIHHITGDTRMVDADISSTGSGYASSTEYSSFSADEDDTSLNVHVIPPKHKYDIPYSVFFSPHSPIPRPVPGCLSDGGILSADKRDIYYLGIIDFLQRYDMGKRAERFVKVVCLQKDGDGLSVTGPSKYQKRFVERLSGVFE